ncbi:MAG: ATP synthase F1 subunit epsilon [Solirubrobacterales bacterium]|nr:ATP synthase F1 subunit epsilon [Solirubrobacterales bacterium]
MPYTPFPVEVLTPEGEVFNGQVQQVSTKTTAGEIGILANHEPLLASLEATELRLHTSDTETLRFETGEGYLQVADNHVLILVKEAKPAS